MLPLLPAMAESRAWAGTCHRGSAGKEETLVVRVIQAGPEEFTLNPGCMVPL